jgi:hypothetical protein
MGDPKTGGIGMTRKEIEYSNTETPTALPWVFAAHPRIGAFIKRFVARHRFLALVRAAGWAAAAAIGWLLVSCLADRLFHLPRPLRGIWFVSDALLFVAILLPAIRRLISRKIDWIAAADQIERLSPVFGQRLQTAASQLLAEPSKRGSVQLLQSILSDLDREITIRKSLPRIPRGPVVRGWGALAILAIVCGALLTIPSLGMPRLLVRAFDPWRNLSPVTTTRLAVDPGDAQVPPGKDLNITVTAQRLGEDLPVISLSEDGITWQRQTMTYLSQDHFSYILSGIDRDLKYFVEGGDAQSPQFSIRSLRPPAIVEFRLSYNFPDYVLRAPSLPAYISDGLIEAPAGTEATIAAVSTEPLASATLLAGDQRIEMSPTNDPAVRECKIRVDHDEKLDLSLVSDRGISASGPAMAVRVMSDLPPAVRFLQPAEDLRLSPRDVVPIGFLATDDFGVNSVGVRVQVNLMPGREFAANLTGSPLYRRGVYMLDLAPLDLKVGDLVRISLVARDAGGHETLGGEERFILISPRAIDSNAHVRTTELYRAQGLANSLAEDLDAAAAAIQNARHIAGGGAGDADVRDPQALLAAREDLSSATDAAALLKQALLRADLHSDSPELSIVLANWLDAAQSDAGTADRAADSLDTAVQGRIPGKLSVSATASRQIGHDLEIVAGGESASMLIAQRQELAAAATQPVEAGQEAIRSRMDREFADDAALLKLDPADADIEKNLAAIVARERLVLSAQSPVDFVQAARDWAQNVKQSRIGETDLDSRLALAAQAESLRPDTNLIRAHDLELASRAAAAIASRRDAAKISPDEYPPALKDLEAADLAGPDAGVREGAKAAARQKMIAWAGSAEQNPGILDAVMQANADMAGRDFAAAAKADQLLAGAAMRPDFSARSISLSTLRSQLGSAMTAIQNIEAQRTKMDPASQNPAAADLNLALSQSLHQAAIARLAQVPALAPILDYDLDEMNLPAAGGDAFASSRSGVRQWGQLQSRAGQNISAGARETNPAGYEESIKAYFEALNHAGG